MAPPNTNLGQAAENIENSLSSAKDAMEALTSTSMSGGRAFEDLAKAAQGSDDAVTSLGKSLGSILRLLPGLGLLANPVENLAGIMGGLVGVTGDFVIAISETIGIFDALTRISRDSQKSMFDIAAGFGLSFDAAKKFSDYVLISSRKLASAEFGWIDSKEVQDMTKALGDAGIPFNILTGTVAAAGKSMDLYAASILHARALSMEASEYTAFLSNAIIKQGLSADDAMVQMASFGSISEETGLAVSDIASNLQGLSNNFSKLGLSAEFGRPILEGFTKTLSGMGLGIESALELSSGLSSALAGLTSDYSAAYVTFQRGGLDMGGGGALGAGIGLQAKMLDIEKSGGDQSQLATEMVSAMKDTLSSFAGGKITTVQEAAANPELQAQYYAQTKLLGDLYNIQDPQTAARTLDFLSQLDSTIASGDQDSVNALYDQIKSGANVADSTLSELDKLNITTEHNKEFLQSVANNTRLAADASAIALRGLATLAPDAFIESGMAENLDSGVDSKVIADQVNNVTKEIGDLIIGEGDPMTKIKNYLEALFKTKERDSAGSPTVNTENPIVKAINALSGEIGKVLGRLEVTERIVSELRKQ